MIKEITDYNSIPFESLKGLTFSKIDVDIDSILFTTNDGAEYELAHIQDCCETVELDDVCGDLNDLLDCLIEVAEECSSYNLPPKDKWDESYTWTFYRLATHKGWVVLRFYGTSNGYYSEDVTLFKLSDADRERKKGPAPGDKVWMFFPQDNNIIRECEIVEWRDDEACFLFRIVGLYRERPYTAFKADAFPTREALCEYYRKIFE